MKADKSEDRHDIDANLQELVSRVGGRFKLTALIQKRLRSLNAGSEKLVDIRTRNLFMVAFTEALEGQIEIKKKEPEK